MDDDNEYLALRRAKIARNEARLKELGLHKVSQFQERKVTNVPKNDNAKPKFTPSVRRSLRKRQHPSAATQHEEIVNKDASMVPIRKTPKVGKRRASMMSNKVEVPPHSARAMSLNAIDLLFGHNITSGLLGEQMGETGKAYVMEQSAYIAANGYPGRVSFNKYSGVQEWGNDVLFLWVNLDAPNSEVTNEFLDDGKQVTWFGGSRMHQDTAVIQKLNRVGSAKDLQQNPNKSIILWCRKYVFAKKTFSPYVCLGRLSLASYDPQSHPLKFVWNLIDFDFLRNSQDDSMRTRFCDLCS